MLTISHDATVGTTIQGEETREAKEIIKSMGLKWSPTRSAWYKLKSVGQTDKSLVEKWLKYYKYELEKAGYECETKIEIQSQEEINQSLKEIYENRLERYEDLSIKKHNEANELSEKAFKMVLQTNCQPVLIGHHSEGRHRNMLKNSDNKIKKAIEMRKVSDYYESKSKSAELKLKLLSDDYIEKTTKAKEFLEQLVLKIRKSLKKDTGAKSASVSFKGESRKIKHICYCVDFPSASFKIYIKGFYVEISLAMKGKMFESKHNFFEQDASNAYDIITSKLKSILEAA